MDKHQILKTAKKLLVWAVAAVIVVKVVKPLLDKVAGNDE